MNAHVNKLFGATGETRASVGQRYASGVALTCMLAGSLVLLGWAFDLVWLKSVIPGAETMKVNTALCFVLLGGALWRQLLALRTVWALLLVIALAAGGLLQNILSVNFGIDELIVRDPLSTTTPGRMAPATAIGLIGSACALLLAARRPAVAVGLALVPGAVGLVALLGYLFSTQALYGVRPFSSVAFPTAVLLLLFATALLGHLSRHGFMQELSGNPLGARTARWMFFWSASLLLPLAALRLAGERLGLYGLEFGLALMLLIAGAVMTTVIWFAARTINRDEARLLLAQSVFDQMAEAIAVTDAQTNIIAVNPGFTRITGYSAEDALGKNPRFLQSGRQSPAFYQSMWRTLLEHGYWRGEIDNKRKSGEIYPELLSIKALRDATGAVTHYVGVFSDLSERLAEERRLKILTHELDLALEVGAIGTWHWQPASKTLEADSRLCSMLGLAPGSAPEKLEDWLQRVASRDREKLSAMLMHLAARPQSLEIEIKIRRPDGQERILSLRGNGEEEGEGSVILVSRDITEQRAIEEEILRLNTSLERQVETRTAELRATMRELEAFSYTVAHDLRTPLRSLEGFSQVLLLKHGDTLDTEARDYLERIRAAGQRMNLLIEDILQLARLSRSVVQFRPVDLTALAKELAEELQRSEPQRQVSINIEPGLAAEADATLARIVLGNLLSNAWKYTGRRAAARIEVAAEALPDGHKVYLVRDNGAGFEMEFAGNLFKPFHRLHREDEFPGTGVGLAAVARAVERMGGKVWAEGAVGEGATFRFTLDPRAANARA